jgi:hypothetical protein
MFGRGEVVAHPTYLTTEMAPLHYARPVRAAQLEGDRPFWHGSPAPVQGRTIRLNRTRPG